MDKKESGTVMPLLGHGSPEDIMESQVDLGTGRTVGMSGLYLGHGSPEDIPHSQEDLGIRRPVGL